MTETGRRLCFYGAWLLMIGIAYAPLVDRWLR